MNIPLIRGVDIRIRDIDIRPITTYRYSPPRIPQAPPVTLEIGVPVVDMPGCVEAHEQNSEKEKSGILKEDDPKGVKVFCDAGVPAFSPIDYNKGALKFNYEAPVPPIKPTEETKSDTPKGAETPPSPTSTCPTEAQKLKKPIGTLVEGGTKKIVEYRLVGKECIPIKEDLKFTDQIIKAIPSAGQVTTTASIAVVATAAATATPLLLKVVKPIVKKIIKKVQKLLGKKPPKLTPNDIQTDKYREKKGLPPIKRSTKKK